MKIIDIKPFWKLQTNKQIGLDLGITLTKFEHMRDFNIYQLQIDLIFIRILININKRI